MACESFQMLEKNSEQCRPPFTHILKEGSCVGCRELHNVRDSSAYLIIILKLMTIGAG
jgi:hypothetical protein